jgi:hypothetical protein
VRRESRFFARDPHVHQDQAPPDPGPASLPPPAHCAMPGAVTPHTIVAGVVGRLSRSSASRGTVTWTTGFQTPSRSPAERQWSNRPIRECPSQ